MVNFYHVTFHRIALVLMMHATVMSVIALLFAIGRSTVDSLGIRP